MILLTLAAAEFVIRGPVRFLTEGFAWNDFIAPFVQTRLWLGGSDPYSPKELVRAWPSDAVQFSFLKKDLADGTLVAKRGVPSPYPPTTFVLLAPLAHLSWRVAHVAWLVLMLISVGMICMTIVAVARIRLTDSRSLLLIASMLALAPFHTATATGNIALPAFACGLAAVWAQSRHRPHLAGILIVISACLKPPVALPFLAYYMFRRNWRLVLTSAATGAGICAIAIGRMAVTKATWLSTYLADTTDLFRIGAINDFTAANELRFHLLNLQMPLYALLGSAVAANVIAWNVAATLLVFWIGLLLRRNSEDPLLELSTLAVIAMLPMYHRFVDAVVVVLPICWIFTERAKSLRGFPAAMLVATAPFLVPGAAMLSTLANAHLISKSVLASLSWQFIALPHQVWATLVLAVVLLAAMAVETSGTSQMGVSAIVRRKRNAWS